MPKVQPDATKGKERLHFGKLVRHIAGDDVVAGEITLKLPIPFRTKRVVR